MQRWLLGGSMVAALLFVSAEASAGKWKERPATGPIPSERSAPAVAALGKQIYLFGGVMDDFSTGIDSFYGDTYRYDTRHDRWHVVNPAGTTPHARAFGSTAAHDGKMYMFGGAHYGPFFSDFIAFDDLWSFDPDCDTWSLVQATNAGPFGRAGAAMWVKGHKIYIFGGVDAFFGVHNDLWSFNLNTGAWTNLIADGVAGSPPARHIAQHSPDVKHDKATIYGGESIDQMTFEFSILADTWQYDHSSNSWTNVTPAAAFNIDPARNYGAAGMIGNRLILQGGDLPGGEDGCGSPFPQNATEEIWAFHLTQHKWTKLSPNGDPLTRIKRTGAAVVGDRLYVFSGWDFQCPGGVGPGQVWNRKVWSYDD